MRNIFIYLFFFVVCLPRLLAAPKPGDVFREYTWYNQSGDAGHAVRVGGNNFETYPDRKIVGDYWITQYYSPSWNLDLEHATHAEFIVEKILCHDGTQGLAVQFNDSSWLPVPVSPHIGSPARYYQHHIYPVDTIPLDYLKAGNGNKLRLRVKKNHSWNWPQNLVYGVHVRVYYDSSYKAHPKGFIVSPAQGDTLETRATLAVQASSPNSKIYWLEFIGNYRDVNWEGDGVYKQWHYHYLHGALMHNLANTFNYLGQDSAAVFQSSWNTEWVPDQEEPFKIAVRMRDADGMIYFSESVKDLQLDRSAYSVELCEPYNIPRSWVTRSSEYTEKVDIQGNLEKATQYQLCWTSWSPGYMNGLYVNGKKVFSSEGPHYDYFAHRLTFSDVSPLVSGVNLIKTGKTPLYNGQMVHGMEVEWPGIMMLVKYDMTTAVEQLPSMNIFFELKDNYPNPFNPVTVIAYQLPNASHVKLSVYNIRGQLIATLVDEDQSMGSHKIEWNAGSFSSGLYFYRIDADNFVDVKKMMFMK